LPDPVLGVVRYLALINGLIAVFNLIPAFPLDGGRVFRAALWHWKGDFRWATRIAARVGETFGFLMIAFGVVNILTGNFVGGMWWFLIGLFLRAAAGASHYQLLTRRIFEGEPVRRFMSVDPVAVAPEISIRRFVEDYVYEYHYDLFPVAERERLIGCVASRQVKAVPRDEWNRHTIAEIMEPCTRENMIDAETDAVKAISIMRQSGNSRLMVVENDRLVGIVALKDMLELFALKMDLEGPE
jgi:CBS domain-containing protein